jgi:hypothetical protein
MKQCRQRLCVALYASERAGLSPPRTPSFASQLALHTLAVCCANSVLIEKRSKYTVEVAKSELFYSNEIYYAHHVLSVKWRRGESAPSDTKPIRNAVVVATADCVTHEERHSRRSFTLKTQGGAMKVQVLIAHRANWDIALKESLEVGADVGGAILVPIQRKHAVSLCATPQSPYFFTHCRLLLVPRATGTEAAAASL